MWKKNTKVAHFNRGTRKVGLGMTG